MRRPLAALGSVIFFCVAPVVVAGLIPWWITGWRAEAGFPTSLRVVGGVVLVAGVAVLLQSFIRFVVEGLGTPAPVAPTARLVVGGLYRFVRNPMYVAVVAAILGQALLLGRSSLLWYALVIGGVQAAFVRFYEEPELRQRFGADYDAYRRAVPAWWPRLRPWRATE